MRRQTSFRRLLRGLAFALMAAMLLSACEDDAQRIREQNQAALNPPAPRSDTARINAFEVRQGDCIADYIADGYSEVMNVRITACNSAAARYRAVALVLVPDRPAFPGDAYLEDQFYERCPFEATFFMFPTVESWAQGDRTITCLEELR